MFSFSPTSLMTAKKAISWNISHHPHFFFLLLEKFFLAACLWESEQAEESKRPSF
jgi:hypothetical protein